MEKIKINLDDPKTKATWAAIQRAKAEVASWPPSKRREDGPAGPPSPIEASPAQPKPNSTE